MRRIIAALVTCILLTGCSSAAAVQRTSTVTVTASAAATAPVLVPVSVTYTVTKVVDGDTIDVTGSDGSAFRVRVIGIDTPPASLCAGSISKLKMHDYALGKIVVLTPGGGRVADVDKYNRKLRYVDIDGVDIGLALIKSGDAKARYDSRDGYPRHDRQDVYVEADAAAPDYVCP